MAALSLCLLAGCASAPKRYSSVLEGMTRHNLQYWFGQPLRIDHLASGGENWYYRFSSWQTMPVSESGTRDEFGQPTTYVSGGLVFSRRVDELPVHLSPDGYVIPPVPKGKVVKD